MGNNYPGDNCPEDNYPGAISLSPSNIFSIVISTNIPWDQSFGGVSSNIKLSAKKSKCVQTTGQFNVQISLVFSCTSLYSTQTKTHQIDENIISAAYVIYVMYTVCMN